MNTLKAQVRDLLELAREMRQVQSDFHCRVYRYRKADMLALELRFDTMLAELLAGEAMIETVVEGKVAGFVSAKSEGVTETGE